MQIIRFNRAPTKGYSRFVGTKTNMRFVNTQTTGFREHHEIDVQQMQSESAMELLIMQRDYAPSVSMRAKQAESYHTTTSVITDVF